MLKIVISQNNLKGIIDAVSHLTPDARIQILPDGIKIEAVDPANVAMVSLHASNGAFQFFKADPGTIALDLLKLSSLASGKEDVSLELDEENHKLKIAVGRSKYTMSLLDPAGLKGNPRIPQLDLPAMVAMPGGEFRYAVTSALKVSDHIVIEQHESEFKISAKGDIDSFEMPFSLTEMLSVRQGESRAVFSLDYVDDISKVAAKAAQVMIESGTDYPSRISFNIGESISVHYLLAPRIEQE